MTLIEFESFLNSLFAFFQKELPKKQTGVLWFEEVNNIPSVCLDYIFKKLKHKEAFPRNLPSTMWALYYSWMDDNPDKKARENKGCAECEDGYFFAHKDGQEYVFACRTCNVGFLRHGQETNKYSLLNSGYELSWHHLPTREIQKLNFSRAGGPVIPQIINNPEENDWHDQF